MTVPGLDVQTEQYIPVWDLPAEREGEPIRRARLDITGTYQGEPFAVDCSIAVVATTDESRVSGRAISAGKRAKEVQHSKHSRYPPIQGAPRLVAFVIEDGGRVGDEAR